MAFQPEVGQEITIDKVTYRFAPHPVAAGMPYGQEGRAAVVYQVAAGAERRALKVFKASFRVPALVGLAKRLAPFAGRPGLRVCQRTVLTAERHPDLLRRYPDLTYAVLMPWIAGPTWKEVVETRAELASEQSLGLARSLAGVLSGLEQGGLAHCDLSGPNVLLPGLAPASSGSGQAPVEPTALVDVEQMYGPGLERPAAVPAGSPGYAHCTATRGLWEANADRFAGAILLAEMLGWCDRRVRDAACDESYFDPRETIGDSSRPPLPETGRCRTLVDALASSYGPGAARLFERAWQSRTLAECPTFGEWLATLPRYSGPDASTDPLSGPGPAPLTGAELIGPGGRVWQLQGNRVRVGRVDPRKNLYPDVDLTPFDPGKKVSRLHAVLERRGADWFVRDEPGVVNRTLLNGRFLTPDEEGAPIHDGDRLCLGVTTLVFRSWGR